MKNKVKGFIKEFKEFIKRGNVIDLAVGVVIGTAFTKIVNSIVNDIIMPLVGIILGGLDFSNLVLKVGDSSILFGSFINNVLSFFIIAICVFLLVKFINRFMRKKEATEEVKVEEPKKTNEELLLENILKELKKSNKAKK